MTSKQKMVLDFITDFISKNGYSPSYRQIAKGLSISSTNTIFRAVKNLKELGLIEMAHRKHRGVRLNTQCCDCIKYLKEINSYRKMLWNCHHMLKESFPSYSRIIKEELIRYANQG